MTNLGAAPTKYTSVAIPLTMNVIDQRCVTDRPSATHFITSTSYTTIGGLSLTTPVTGDWLLIGVYDLTYDDSGTTYIKVDTTLSVQFLVGGVAQSVPAFLYGYAGQHQRGTVRHSTLATSVASGTTITSQVRTDQTNVAADGTAAYVLPDHTELAALQVG